MDKLRTLTTEKRNEYTMKIDDMATEDILQVINDEDRQVANRVTEVLPDIQKTVDVVYDALCQGGKLFYIGAGTSGRIGILDAVECPPTFSTPPDLIQAVMAGGDGAFMRGIEGAEDSEEFGAKDLAERDVTEIDVVIGKIGRADV